MVEVPDREDYRGKLEGLCGNMDNNPESEMSLFTTWDKYGEQNAEGLCQGATQPMPAPCEEVRRTQSLLESAEQNARHPAYLKLRGAIAIIVVQCDPCFSRVRRTATRGRATPATPS